MKENPSNADWSMESMRFLSAWESRGFSFRNSRSKLLQSLGDFCVVQVRDFIKVKVTNMLYTITFTLMIYWYNTVCSGKKALTTFGLKGGSTSLLSSAGQLMVLKNGCVRMSPTTPNLRVGSRSNSWNNDKGQPISVQKHKTTCYDVHLCVYCIFGYITWI